MSRRVKIAVLACSHLLLVAAVAGAAYLAFVNDDRADEWQARAGTLAKNVAALNTVLVERSATLNARTKELNAMAGRVREAQAALRRSEEDVADLAKRQRELANEKAQVEDERASLSAEADALQEVASAHIDCKSGLVDLLSFVADDDYVSVDLYLDGVSADCARAENSLSVYLARYGG